jgi:hypothetical protein
VSIHGECNSVSAASRLHRPLPLGNGCTSTMA